MNKFAYIALVFGVTQAIKLSKSDFMTDEQYQVLHAKALFEKENPMADFEEDDHLVQLGRNDFMTDEQYGAIHAQKMWEKEHPMADEEAEDHLIQL